MNLTRRALVTQIEEMLKSNYPDHTVTSGDRGVTVAKNGTSWTIAITSSLTLTAALRATAKKK